MSNKAVEGLKRVPTIRARTQADKDRDARASGSKLSVPTGLEKPDPISTPYNKLMGLFESITDPGNWEGPVGTAAGLPFAAIAKLKGLREVAGKPAVFHGTRQTFDTFDPTKNDVFDKLGWMTHFAEDPQYADVYAAADGLKVGQNPGTASRVIPAHLDAKNTFDTINPSIPDLETYLAALPPHRRNSELANFKADKKHWKPGSATKKLAQNSINRLANDPDLIKRTPFDAVRYLDGGEPTWAIPNPAQATTPWGTPLGQPARTKRLTDFKVTPKGSVRMSAHRYPDE